MAQNYRNQDLRGRNFAGENLTNADFSGADVSGAKFRGANLTKANFNAAKLYSANFKQAYLPYANFRHSQCGPRGWVAAVKGGGSFALSFMFTFIAAFFYAIIFILSNGSNSDERVTGVVSIGVIVSIFAYIFRKGINNQILTVLSFAFAFAFAFAVAFTGAIAIAFAVAVVGAVAFAIAFAVAVAGAGAFAVAGAIAGAGAVAVAVAFAGASTAAFAGAVIGAGVSTGATALFVSYIAWRTYKSDPKFALVHGWGVRIGIFGSTSFHGAILSHADFGEASLRFGDFRRATFTSTNWANTKQLELAQFDRDYLNTPALRQLAITHDGRGQTYDGLNLSGLNLAEAQLQGVSFVSANLNNVNLCRADLSEAVLKQTQLDNADLHDATLHGATIEDWGITVNTQLDGIRCTHVFMRVAEAGVTNRLRKPDNENTIFADGDFAEFIRPFTDTLDLYHSQYTDPRAMATAFKIVSESNPDDELEVVAMERRGKNGFNIKVKVAPYANKSTLNEQYFNELKRFEALAEAIKHEITTQRKSSDGYFALLESALNNYQGLEQFHDPTSNLPQEVRAFVLSLNNYFNMEEFKHLCFEMGIDDENLPGDTKIAKIRTLVKHCHRTATLAALKQHLLAQRPNLRDQLGG